MRFTAGIHIPRHIGLVRRGDVAGVSACVLVNSRKPHGVTITGFHLFLGFHQVVAALSYKFLDSSSRCFAAPVLWSCAFLCAGLTLCVVCAMAAVDVTVGAFVASTFGMRVVVKTFPRLAAESPRGGSLAITGTAGF